MYNGTTAARWLVQCVYVGVGVGRGDLWLVDDDATFYTRVLCGLCGVDCVMQAERGYSQPSQMADPAREEEQVTLLGEEGLRAGGQALKLG